MEKGVIETISGFFKRKKEEIKTKQPVPGWDYPIFREYLIALSKSRDYLLPIEGYPARLDLSEDWHKLFNKMRPSLIEEWALIGFETGQCRLVLPKAAEKGLNGFIPHQVTKNGLEKARNQASVTGYVGDIHSHPTNLFCAFSLADMHGLLSWLEYQRPSDPRRLLRFVVGGEENLAVFASQRSLGLVRDNFEDSEEKFASKWYGKFGWKYLGYDDNGEKAKPTKTAAPELWQINRAIAHHYQLTLYRGKINEPLIRDYPAIPDTSYSS